MKKIVTTTTPGGAPIYLDDFKDVFNDEIWDAVQALLSRYDSDTQGVIVSGCVVGGSGPSSYTISAGIVYIDGEFRRLAAQTGLSLPQYIQSDADVNTQRTFEDSVLRTLYVTKGATVAGSAPGSGQYIAITTTTDPDDRRLSNLQPSIPFDANDLDNNSVTTAKIADDAVTFDKIANYHEASGNTNSGGTATTLLTIPFVSGSAFTVDAQLEAIWKSGSDGAGNASGARKVATYRGSGATPSIAGSVTTLYSHSTTAGAPTLNLSISGNNILVTATAGSGETYSCKVVAIVQYVNVI